MHDFPEFIFDVVTYLFEFINFVVVYYLYEFINFLNSAHGPLRRGVLYEADVQPGSSYLKGGQRKTLVEFTHGRVLFDHALLDCEFTEDSVVHFHYQEQPNVQYFVLFCTVCKNVISLLGEFEAA